MVKIQSWPIERFKPDPKNARKHSKRNLEAIKYSLKKFGQQKNVVALEDGTVIAGNGTLQGAKEIGLETLDVKIFDGTADEARAYAIADNRSSELAEWDIGELVSQIESLQDFDLGFGDKEIKAMISSLKLESGDSSSLAERFGVPPFSIFDARQGYWKDRKAAWLGLGIESEVGRGSNLLKMSDTVLEPNAKKRAVGSGVKGNPSQKTGTSIFDPVLCELIYRWFCPTDGQVLDPFAGGSVRGIVAGFLGFDYFGIDLRKEQVQANEQQSKKINCAKAPVWKVGDSLDLKKIAGKLKADLIFSCPPYFDLEKYSDNPKDLSGLAWEDFKKAYKKIVAEAVALLVPNSFACFVVGDIRDKKGFYRNFTGLTVEAFEEAGAKLYNEAILITSAGTLALRVGRAFVASRKLGKSHQNVLIFYKGEVAAIRKRFDAPEFGELPGAEDD